MTPVVCCRGIALIGIEEPAPFSKPGVFTVRADSALDGAAVQTTPFTRPHFDELLGALDVALTENDPARRASIGAV